MKPYVSGRMVTISTVGLCLTVLFCWVGSKFNESRTTQPAAEALPAAVADASPAPLVIADEQVTAAAAWDMIPLPLEKVVTEAENGMWLTDSDYLRVPRGTVFMGPIPFSLRGMIQMQGKGSEEQKRSYRIRVQLPLAETGLRDALIGSIHLLCGTRFSDVAGSEVAEVVWQYADRKRGHSPVLYLQHVRDWNRNPYEEPARLPYAHSKAVWRSPVTTEAGRQQRLYRLTLANPEPSRPVAAIYLESGKGRATLFVVAATVDSLPPGARLDDSPDMEPVDAAPPNYLHVWVQNREGQPLPKAQVSTATTFRAGGGLRTANEFTADASGAVRIPYPPGKFERLEVTASYEECASRKMWWDVQAGDVIPATYVFKLPAGIAIGGRVVDESEGPVIDAELSFHRFWTGGDDMNVRGIQAGFSSKKVNTDSAGMWRITGLPEEILNRVGFDVKHPGYVSTNFTVGGPMEPAFRAGTAKIVLQRGSIISGVVLNEQDVPIPGASVWTSRRYHRDRQQTKTDSEGRFQFSAVLSGESLISAMAAGYSPESRPVQIQPGMPEVVFRLTPGNVIRGIVQSETSEPIQGVRIVLEGDRGNMEGYEFSTTTGADGRFEWDAAPNEPMQFYIGKSGYLQVRNRKLNPGVENVIVLSREERVEGTVLDAQSGQPVTKFKAAIGQTLGTDGFYPEYPGLREFTDANGRFTLKRTELQSQNRVQVTAEDYAEQIQSMAKSEGGVITMEFRLKPSPSIRGVVVGPDGRPLPGIQVTLLKGSGPVYSGATLAKGKLEGRGPSSPIVVTDETGQFVLGSAPESGGTIFAIGAAGSGSARVEEIRATGRVVLQPFGEVEGILKIGGAPAAGYPLLFTFQSRGLSSDFSTFRTTTDADGRFSFTQVPAGQGEIVRLVSTSPSSWMHSHRTAVNVEAGRVTQVTLGESGAIIQGRMRLELLPESETPTSISGRLSSQRPGPGFFDSTPAEATRRTYQTFAFTTKPDGSFTIDSVPPGDYLLNIEVTKAGAQQWQRITIASGKASVTVPEGANPASPINIGEVAVTPTTAGSR